MLFSESDKKKIADAVQEIEDSLTRQDAEKGLIKDICDDIKDSTGVPPKAMKQWADMLHKRNKEKMQEEFEELIESYEAMFDE